VGHKHLYANEDEDYTTQEFGFQAVGNHPTETDARPIADKTENKRNDANHQ
jgi:hypothetical protein